MFIHIPFKEGLTDKQMKYIIYWMLIGKTKYYQNFSRLFYILRFFLLIPAPSGGSNPAGA